MSISGYIGKNVKELQLPREGADELGIRYVGAEDRVNKEKAEGDEEVYESVADYDPVLRSHCRL